ncbi:MFS transporter [Patulibacter defluvii]|uniref:MFS transporter n=1 Tax=Patulibacter defluvii TaxID=3095358 RepID=UPI002A755392|nr:MFS transporter [Patulibacter sp. DM4]
MPHPAATRIVPAIADGLDRASTDRRPRRRSSRSPRAEHPPGLVLAVASLGVFMAFVDATVVNIAFPDIERSFPTTGLDGLQWVLNAYNIVFAAFLVAAGRLADRAGRKRFFLAGLGVFTAASVACAAAPTVEALVAARVVQATGAAMLVPSSLAIVLHAVPLARRARAVALWTASAALAAGVGPTLGGLLVSASDWRLVFLVNVPVGLLAWLSASVVLRESRERGHRGAPDLLGALLLAAALGGLVLAIVQGEAWGWTSAPVLGAAAAALVLGLGFALRNGRHAEPLVDPSLLRIRNFSIANAMTIVGAAGFYAYTLCNVLFLTSVWGYSIVDASLALTPGPLVAVAIAGPTSRIVDRFGLRAVALPGGLLWCGGLVWLIERVEATPDFLGVWLPAMVLLGLGAGTLFPNVSGAAVVAAPGSRFATATALNAVARQLGAAIGVAIVVAIVGTPRPEEALRAFDHGWTFAAVGLAIGAIGCLAVGQERARARTPRPVVPPSLASARIGASARRESTASLR